MAGKISAPRIRRIPFFPFASLASLAALALCGALAGAVQGQVWQPLGPKRILGATPGNAQVLEFFGTEGYGFTGVNGFRTVNFGKTWDRLEVKPGTSSVNSMVKLGPFLIVGSASGVYRSRDGGESWSALPQIPPLTYVHGMFAHRGALLVVNTPARDVFRYSDTGTAWTPVVIRAENSLFSTPRYFAADDSALYVGGRGLLKSMDGGKTWTDLMGALYSAYIRFQINPSGNVSSLLAGNGRLYAGVEGGVYRSSDRGSTWSPMLIVDSNAAFSALALAGDALLAGNVVEGIWRIPLDASPASRIEGFGKGVSVIRGSDSGVFASSPGGLYRSVDGGRTWGLTGFLRGDWEIGILTSRNGAIHAGGRGSPLYRSLDQGASWVLNSEIPALFWIKSMTWNGDSLFAVSGQGANDLYVSEDGGTDWVRLGGDQDSLEFETVSASAGTLYASALDSRFQTCVLIRSQDQGRTWSPAADRIENGRAIIGSLAFGPSSIHAGSDSGYYRIDAATGKVNASALKGKSILKLTALEGRLFASGTGSDVWYSQDQGLTWEKPTVAVPWIGNVTAFAGEAQTAYAGTLGSGVYRSTNGGSSWEPFHTGGLDPKVSSLVLEGGRLYAGTPTSVYGLDVGGTSSLIGAGRHGGKSGKGTRSLLEKGKGLPYLEAIHGDGRYRIFRLDGRQVSDGSIGPGIPPDSFRID